jgi:hypothetical protein
MLADPFPATAPTKDFFSGVNGVNPIGWFTGTAGVNGALTYVGQQGSEGTFYTVPGNIYGVYATNPGFSVTVPAGTNFFQADGNPLYEDTIYQTISGLTAGTTYTLQFQQASGQQASPDFTGPTTEQWKVYLGVGGIGVDCSANPCTVTGTTNNLELDSPLMSNANGSNTDWESVTMSFTPTAADLTNGTAILTFLAWGDGGDTINEPPTLFLEGVNTPVVPEPATLSLLGAGILGLFSMRRRRALRKAQQ